MNLTSIILGERSSTKVLFVWFHLYEILKKTKKNCSDRKISLLPGYGGEGIDYKRAPGKLGVGGEYRYIHL